MSAPRHITRTGEVAQHPWPEDLFIQGGNGIAFTPDGQTYRTAFVEAFPDDPPTFLRGEGNTIAEAEDNCWKQYQRYAGCPHGKYERRQYRNGSGFCVHCGTWLNKVFEPLPEDPEAQATILDRLFRDKDPDLTREVLGLLENQDELPTRGDLGIDG